MNERTGEAETLEEFAEGSILPTRICERLDGGPLVEVIFCDSLAGGKNYINEMPARLSLIRRLADGTEYRAEYRQHAVSIEPIDVMLFCPKCGELHVDRATPEVCETCGHMEHMHDLTVSSLCCSQPACECLAFKAWLNPPHKSHRCGNCNFVWRPADVPTNGVAHAKTKGENDDSEM